MNTDAVLPVLFELLAKSALISLAATLLTRAWRGATAAQRHLVWLVALVIVMMLPTTRLVAPLWKIPLVPAKQVTVVRTLPTNAHPAPIKVDSSAVETIAPAPVHVAPDWRKILVGIWLGGAAFLLSYRLFGSWRLHRLMRHSRNVDDPRIRLLLSRTLSELGLHRRPEIRLSEECRVPLTWGSLRPVMLLPTAALQWNDTWLTAALRHEAAHIRRYDYLTRWFAHVACAVYWPNPLVWLLVRSLRVAQELAADDLVLRAGTPAEDYASQLVDAARAITTHGFFVRQAVAMACPSTLEDRVRAIVDGRRDRRPLSRLAAACGSIAIALSLALSTAAQLRSDEQKPVPADKAPASAPQTKSGPQIEIDTKFVEFDPAGPGDLATQPENPAIYSDPQFQLIWRALNQKKGVDLMSSPRVTTRANQRAVLEVIREFRFPTDWEKDGGIWKPTKFETKNVGTTLEVEPRIQEDGAIQLHAVANVVVFLGIVDLDTGNARPAPKVALDAALAVPPVDPGHRIKYVFSERKRDGTFTLHSGETVGIPPLPEKADVKPFEQNAPHNKLLVFISSRILAPAPAKEAPKDGEAATATPAEVSTILSVDKAGNVKVNGEPLSRDDLEARLQKLKTTTPGGPDILIRGDADTPYKTVMDVLEIIQKAGISNAGFVSPVSKEGAAARPRQSITDHATIRFENSTGTVPGTANTLNLTGGTLAFGKAADGTLVSAGTLDLSGDVPSASGGATPAAEAGAKPGAETDGPALAKAKKIIIPKVELREASLEDALEYLRKKAVEFDPDKTGVKLVLKPGTVSDAKVTMSLTNIPLIEAMKYLTDLANLEFVATPDALVVQPVGAGKSGAKDIPNRAAALAQATDVLRKAYETLNETEKWEEKLQAEAAKAGRPVPQFPPKSSLQKSILGEKEEAGDRFARAYLIMRESEKLEQAQQFQEALARMQTAKEMFDQITASDPDWQPQIMDYRKKKVAEALRRLQSKL